MSDQQALVERIRELFAKNPNTGYATQSIAEALGESQLAVEMALSVLVIRREVKRGRYRGFDVYAKV